MFDSKKARRLGTIHAWGKDFRSTVSGTLQFKEFVLYQLRDGQLYTLSQDGGHPGGAFADPSLVIPKHGDVVLLGGAEGLVVGGTGNYRNAGGPYSTRLKLETIGGVFVYYDELFFRFREVEISSVRLCDERLEERCLALLVVASMLVASGPDAAASEAVRLTVPYVRQPKALCGGAAAAMVFRYWGDRQADPNEFAPLLDRAAGGLATGVLAKAIEDRGWRVVRFTGSIESVADLLRDGRPVIVLLKVGTNGFTTWSSSARPAHTSSSTIRNAGRRGPYPSGNSWTHGNPPDSGRCWFFRGRRVDDTRGT